MRLRNFVFSYFLLIIVQIIICTYLSFSPYLVLSILPALVLSIPLELNDRWVLFIAFAIGLIVDFFSGYILGINSLAMLCIAYLRKFFIYVCIGSEVFDRKTSVSLYQMGWLKLFTTLVLMQALFLLIYVIADGLGTRQLLFNLARIGISIIPDSLLGLGICKILSSLR